MMESRAFAPTVLYQLTLPALLNHILTRSKPTPTTLIVCSSRESFLHHLSRSLPREGDRDAESLQKLIAPTLRNLAAARHVNVTFCASVQALLAYLSAYKPAHEHGELPAGMTLVLLNLLSLHAPTPSFSAQGLSRSFAAAIECALRVDARLVLVEGSSIPRDCGDHEEQDVVMEDAEEGGRDGIEELDPWEQEVPILNVSARRYTTGSGERPWAGRTVKVSRIAGRWFRFSRVKSDGG